MAMANIIISTNNKEMSSTDMSKKVMTTNLFFTGKYPILFLMTNMFADMLLSDFFFTLQLH